MPNGDDPFHIHDDQGARPLADLAMLGLPNVTALQGILDDAINHASLPARQDAVGRRWIPMGPRNIGGRIRALAQDPTNPNVLYAGSAIGGVWKTADAGDTWVPLDLFPRPAGGADIRVALPIGAIAVSQSNPQILYVGTGEAVGPQSGVAPGSQSLSYPAGVGLLRSTDGGATFQIADHVDTGTTKAHRFERLIVDPWNPDRVWIATPTGLWRREGGPPPVITQDAIDGPTAPAAAAQNAVDIAIDFGDRTRPAPPTHFTVYVALQGVGVFRGRFNRATASYDAQSGAVRWVRLASGIEEPTPGRIRIALCQSQPSILYASFERPDGAASPIYRTNNRGDTWKKTKAQPGETAKIAWYAFVLAVHPLQPSILYFGMMDIFRSRNAGDSWEKILDWEKYTEDRAQHADQHALIFDGLDPRKIWSGNDGGISMSRDLGSTWRKRSHGILATQFYDITVHPTFPFVMGGGLQDNGTWLTYGGPSWFYLMQADGGAMGFVPNSLTDYYISWQYSSARATVTFFVPPTPTSTPSPPPPTPPAPLVFLPIDPSDAASPPDYWTSPAPDLALPGGQVPLLVSWITWLNPNISGTKGPFVGLLEGHPTQPNEYLVAWTGGLYRTTNGQTFSVETPPGVISIGAFQPEVTAIAYAPTAPNTDWWMGTQNGHGRVFLTTTGTGGFGAVAIPGLTAGTYIADIAVHPRNASIVAIATAGNPGQLFLTGDKGTTWTEISGSSALPVGVNSPANARLSPSPLICIAFDPDSPVAANAAQILYVGTPAGIYVTRNVIPPVTPLPAPLPAPTWFAFNSNLPLVRINDMTAVALRDGGGVLVRSALRCATMGRGIYECDLLGTPDVQLLIRDHVADDGRTYPGVPALPNDPRQPGGPALRLDRAFDIRVDAPPFSFFDETMDGVEFDEDLVHDVAVAGERNLVYVQIHQLGSRTLLNDAEVHLYFANSPATPPPLQAGFWDSFPADPPAGAWQRAAPSQRTRNLGPAQPNVLRFDWTPPANATPQVALLAVCTHTASDNIKTVPPPLVIDPAASPNAVTDRRIALRLVTVQAFAPEVFVRDGIDDSGLPGAVAWGARAVDIIPSEDPVGAPDVAFKDLGDLRPGDRLVGGKLNHLYVRVFNRKNVPLSADVELYRVPYATLHQSGTWQPVAPKVTVTDIPPKGWKFSPAIDWNAPPDPDPTPGQSYKAHILVAVISRAGDPAPSLASITSLDSFWRYFLEGSPANNAALRVIRWRPNS